VLSRKHTINGASETAEPGSGSVSPWLPRSLSWWTSSSSPDFFKRGKWAAARVSEIRVVSCSWPLDLRPSSLAIPDGDVVTRIRAGEGGLYELLMRRYNQRLFRVIRSVVTNEARRRTFCRRRGFAPTKISSSSRAERVWFTLGLSNPSSHRRNSLRYSSGVRWYP
jgi:hypothetical protein